MHVFIKEHTGNTSIQEFPDFGRFQHISPQIFEVYCIYLYMFNKAETEKLFSYHSSYNFLHIYYYLSKNNLLLQLHDETYVSLGATWNNSHF